MINIHLPLQRHSFYSLTPSAITKGLQGLVRCFLCIMFFGICATMLNQTFIEVSAWFYQGSIPTITEMLVALFFIFTSPVFFSFAMFITGLGFALLVTFTANKIGVPLVTGIIAMVATYYQTQGFEVQSSGVIHAVSAAMLFFSTLGAGFFGALLAFLALTKLSFLFVPERPRLTLSMKKKCAPVQKVHEPVFSPQEVVYTFNMPMQVPGSNYSL